MRGKLIAFEGIDGSGKATQADFLIRNLQRNGYKTKRLLIGRRLRLIALPILFLLFLLSLLFMRSTAPTHKLPPFYRN